LICATVDCTTTRLTPGSVYCDDCNGLTGPTTLVELRLEQLRLIRDMLYERAGALTNIPGDDSWASSQYLALVNETYDVIARSAGDLEPSED
jgi:hypothetical protein